MASVTTLSAVNAQGGMVVAQPGGMHAWTYVAQRPVNSACPPQGDIV